jgi:murein DD-endopeptidase MepM/ murein hydrolase activator NlpD
MKLLFTLFILSLPILAIADPVYVYGNNTTIYYTGGKIHVAPMSVVENAQQVLIGDNTRQTIDLKTKARQIFAKNESNLPVANVSTRLNLPPRVLNASKTVISRPIKGAPSFVWPVRGQLLLGYGDKGGGVVNKGINIATPSNNHVYAAADGEVMYVGNRIKNFGNLALVRHAGQFMTLYGHNNKILVKKGEQVKQGSTGIIRQYGQRIQPTTLF